MRRAILAVILVVGMAASASAQGPKNPEYNYPTTIGEMGIGQGMNGVIGIYKFGSRAGINTSADTLQTGSDAVYAGFLQTADEIRIKASGDAADSFNGAGAREVTCCGLDSAWDQACESVTALGATASAKTTTQFIRVNRCWVSLAGTYSVTGSGANTAAILIETEGGTEVAHIPAGAGQTEMAIYTIPDGYTGFLVRMSASNEDTAGNGIADASLFQRQNADDTSDNMSSKRLIRNEGGLAEGDYRVFEPIAVQSFPPRTDIWWEAVSSATSEVNGTFDIILVPDYVKSDGTLGAPAETPTPRPSPTQTPTPTPTPTP